MFLCDLERVITSRERWWRKDYWLHGYEFQGMDFEGRCLRSEGLDDLIVLHRFPVEFLLYILLFYTYSCTLKKFF